LDYQFRLVDFAFVDQFKYVTEGGDIKIRSVPDKFFRLPAQPIKLAS
jgi:hypothetical protein